MAVDTATIRVSRETRDLLAEQASERGLSLSALLAQMAREAKRDAMFRAERVATRVDAESALARDEDVAWEETLTDGVD